MFFLVCLTRLLYLVSTIESYITDEQRENYCHNYKSNSESEHNEFSNDEEISIEEDNKTNSFNQTQSHGSKSIKQMHLEICKKCENLREKRSHHCKLCAKCVEKMDHHCYFVNNCIGKKNYHYFISYLLLVNVNVFIMFLINCPFVVESIIRVRSVFINF